MKIVTIEDILHSKSIFLLLVQVQTESYLTGTSGSYVEEMYESWARDPRSVHARYVRKIFYCPIATNIFMIFFFSWDAYFRGGTYAAPPSLGDSTRPNEVPLSSLGAWQGAGKVNTGL